MAKQFVRWFLLSVCVSFFAVLPALAVEDILKLVPPSASGFLIINRPAALDAKLQAAGSYLQMPIPSALMMLKMQAGIQEGVNESGSIGLIVMPPKTEGELPSPVILVPVSDYDKFVKQLQPENTRGDTTKVKLFGSPSWVRKIGDYAAMTDGDNRDVIEKDLRVAKELPVTLKAWQPWLAENDVAGVVLQPGMKRLSDKIQQSIARMKAQMGKIDDKQVKSAAAVFDIYSKLVQTAEKEVSALGICLQLDKQNSLIITNRAALVPGGKWATLAGQIKPAKENFLAGLPSEPFFFAGGMVLPKDLAKELVDFSIGIMTNMRDLYGMTPEHAKKMSEASSFYLKNIKTVSMVFGLPKPEETIYGGTVAVMGVDDADAYMANYQKYADEYAALTKEVNSPLLPAPEVEKSEIGGRPAFKMTVKMPQVPDDKKNSAHDKMMNAMFGADGKLVGWITSVDKHRIVFSYTSKEKLQKIVEDIKSGKSGLAGDAELMKTAALLPTDAVAVGYLNPAGMIEFVRHMAKAMSTDENDVASKIPEFAKTPPVGVAVTVASNEVRKCVVVPPEVIKATAQYVLEIQAKRAGAAMPRQ